MKPDLEAIRERAEKATPGPWEKRSYSEINVYGPKGSGRICCMVTHSTKRQTMLANYDFIAHARADIPSLLAYIEELEAKLSNPRAVIVGGKAVGEIEVAGDGRCSDFCFGSTLDLCGGCYFGWSENDPNSEPGPDCPAYQGEKS